MSKRYLDSDEYYQRRQRQTKMILLQRAYFAGFPYTDDPREAQGSITSPGQIWRELIRPTDNEDPPDYIDNVARTKIEDIVADIWPTGSSLVFDLDDGELEDGMKEKILKKLLNFAGGYKSGMKGLEEWVEATLVDAAQGGDALALVQLRKDLTVRFMLYGAEYWDMELEDGDPLFYRVELRVKGSDGKTRIQRVDIYKDHIERYESGQVQFVEADDGTPPPDVRPVATDPMIAGKPPTELYRLHRDGEDEESAVMRQLDDWVCIELRWRRLQHKDIRGTSEMMFNDLLGADDINRMITSWKDAAHSMGNPPMLLLDVDEPKDAQGNKITLNKENLAPGEVLLTSSTDEGGGGKMMYPMNPPGQAPYNDVLDVLRVALMGNTPMSGPNATDVSRFADMSAFAKDIIEKVHRERVARIRERIFDNGIARLLKTGVEILAIAGAVEGLTIEMAKKLEIKFEYGGPMLSADEKVKGITYVAMAQKIGIPARELVPLLPFEPKDRDQLIADMEEKEQQEQQFAEQMQEIALNPPAERPAPGTPKTQPPSTEKVSGQDKRGR